jgi:uncharacterized membrane protein
MFNLPNNLTTLLAAADAESVLSVPITNPAIVLGLLFIILALVFWTNSLPAFKSFYKYVPALLLCYFLPSLLTLFGLTDAKDNSLYYVATRYLLPATLVYLTLCIDLKEIFRLGPKALILFVTGTIGVVIGGPLAILIVAATAPGYVGYIDGEGYDAKWRGYSTVAGSWIGGGANQTAMKELYLPEDKMNDAEKERAGKLFSSMIAVDVIVAEIWMVFLLLGVGQADAIDRWTKADSSSVERLRDKMDEFSKKTARVASATDLMIIGGIGFGATAFAHFFGGLLSEGITALGENTGSIDFLKTVSLTSSFFWLIVLSTAIGVGLSFTKIRNYEGAGASKIGTVFIFLLVAVIGLKMDVTAIFKQPGYFLVGGIWMAIHVSLLFIVGYLIRAPYFFLAVGSKANIGGAASAPVVAAAFHPSLAPVGVLLAVLGYALGTLGAWLAANLMMAVSPV